MLGVLLYMLGLSYRQVSAVLGELGIPASPATIRADVRASGLEIGVFHQLLRRRTRVVRRPLEEAGAPAGEEQPCILIAVNQETGEGLFIESRQPDGAQETLGLVSDALAQCQQAY